MTEQEQVQVTQEKRDTAAKCNCSLPVLGYFDITTHTAWGVGRNGLIYRALLAKIGGEQP